ncbi:aminotransferase class V-fold PLP-dependent enzyme [Aurantibacter crassamenti]|uniref:aminotransferase class V-fold PLP-dependent enzyme n=1 Tax=Aurantibacter crassamenti TaxID=1837375 RepID=UPI00193AA9EE|nr:aminotransferase class V-fold PLP-dependent enzyme [Aurantibacter crassamenti]MBM1108174.1 aminotransferase class V-fold PLP-dependent enzyme [Aurantibacter crassamenti]
MDDIRSKFPVLEKYIYANTASSGLPYTALMEWRKKHDQDFLNGGSIMRDKARDILDETRETVGRFFNCDYENVALVQNFSIGLNMFLEGLDTKEKVLLIENDYPSVAWPFERRGFHVSFAKLDENLEENIRNKILEDKITILAISIVQWLNGIKIDLDFLKKLKAEYPQLLIIADGTQFCGTSEFDFNNSGVDVLGASSYKWLLSGYGNGFMLFKDNIKERSKLKTTGFNAANADALRKDSIPFAKFFEPGHLDTLNFGSLKFSLEFFEKIGKNNIELKIQELSDYAKMKLSDLNLLQKAVIQRKVHSSIFNIKGDASLFEKLKEENIICSLRGDGIRLSFHLYNTKNDIDAIVKILKTVI